MIKPGGLLTWTIFCSTAIVLLISLTPAIFPAFLTKTTTNFEDMLNVEQFEFGVLALPVLLANSMIFTVLLVHYKNWLPEKMRNGMNVIFNFEIPKKYAFIILTVIITWYVVTSIGEVFDNKFDSDYYGIFKPWLEEFDVFTLPQGQLNRDVGHHVQLLFGVISMMVFGNYKVIPFIVSISLLITIYFFTKQITKKRFAGIVSLLITVQSSTFLFYDTSVSYTNLWILFYLLGLYAAYRAWQLSGISYIFAVLSKGLTILFLPVSILFAYRTKNGAWKKTIISYAIIAVIGIIFLATTGAELNPVDTKSFDPVGFITGFTALAFGLSEDITIVSFLLPVICGLLIMSKKGSRYADVIMLIILAMLMSAPLLSAFSDNQNVPYRFVPIVVFFAIGVGIILSKRPIES